MRTNKKVIEEPIGGSSQIYVLPDHVSNPVLAPFRDRSISQAPNTMLPAVRFDSSFQWNDQR